MKEIIIDTLEDYVAEIHNTIDQWGIQNHPVQPWYRGQSNSEWNLIPGIFRNSLRDFEREIVRDFKLNCVNILSKIPANDFEWMFIMQHHSLPTRLLDWTESHLIALYFAVIDYQVDYNACVWIIHPWDLNVLTIEEKTVPVISHIKLKDYVIEDPSHSSNLSSLIRDKSRTVKAQYPVAIRPIRNSQRLIAQKGTFTIHGNQKEGIDTFLIKFMKENQNIRFKKILIEKLSKKKILKQLMYAGISHSVLFPEIDGISEELKIKYLL